MEQNTHTKKFHILSKFLKKTNHPVTIDVVGAGGTGSQLMQFLARVNLALLSLGYNGIYVKLFDPDNVTEANIGRQLFHISDLGKNKAIAIVEKINRYHSLSWEAYTEKYNVNITDADIVISCVDNISSRLEIRNNLKSKHLYFIDCGNFFDSGQVILSTFAEIGSSSNSNVNFLKSDYLDKMSSQQEDDIPSCSLAEALEKQHLMINPMIATIAASLVFEMLTQPVIYHRGAFVNLKTMTMQQIEL